MLCYNNICRIIILIKTTKINRLRQIVRDNMTKAEKISALLAAAFVAVCIFTALKPSQPGITPERNAEISEIMTGGDDVNSNELMPGDKVNINTADLDELCLIPGIGETLGQRIIDFREANGEFTSVDELVDEIDGIGENNIEEMRLFIALEDDAA